MLKVKPKPLSYTYTLLGCYVLRVYEGEQVVRVFDRRDCAERYFIGDAAWLFLQRWEKWSRKDERWGFHYFLNDRCYNERFYHTSPDDWKEYLTEEEPTT